MIHFHRNAGMGNGLHGLQIQIAMRGTVSMEIFHWSDDVYGKWFFF